MVTAVTRIQSVSRSNGGSAPRDDLYSPERQRRSGHLDDPQWRPRHLDGHRDKTLGTRWVLYTIWLCCSWNWTAGFVWSEENWPPDWSWFLPRFFSPFCHRWRFGFLLLSPLACLVGDTSFPAISSTRLHRYYLNWSELDDDITEFNNGMPLTENFVFTLLTLFSYFDIVKLLWHNLYC